MGDVVVFGLHHAASTKPKTAGSGFRFPKRTRRRENSKKYSGGILSRERQLQTAVEPTPANSAAAVNPPTPSITDSTLLSMGTPYSPGVNMSSVHGPGISSVTDLALNGAMAATKRKQKTPETVYPHAEVGRRLKLAREATGNCVQRRFAKLIGLEPNTWNQYEKGKNPFPLEVALILYDNWGITLEWIYRGHTAQLPAPLLKTILEMKHDG